MPVGLEEYDDHGFRVAAVVPSGDARYYLTDQVDSVKLVVDDAEGTEEL